MQDMLAGKAGVSDLAAMTSRWQSMRAAWAVEGAAGLGYLLAQQLRAAGERVLDVQPKLGSPGTASGDRGDEQERSERRPVGRRRCSALDNPTGASGRGPPYRASRSGRAVPWPPVYCVVASGQGVAQG
jgi:hypothetical protein